MAEFEPTADFFERNRLDPDKPIIAVLPGSRKQEIEEMLHEMVAILPGFQEYQFVVAGVNNLDPNYYKHFHRNGIRFVFDQTFDLLSHATAALVTSGTATLETALFGVPQVVCYRTSALSYAIGKMVIKVPYISLVNLIAGREVVKELIQSELRPATCSMSCATCSPMPTTWPACKAGYAELREKLGQHQAARKTAELMVKYLQAG